MSLQLEVCCESLEYALAAIEAGVTRIELCRALTIGGLSPTPDEVKEIKSSADVELMALIRPRGGDFYYSTREKRLILSEITSILDAGADGVVVGGLNTDNSIDKEFLSECLLASSGMPLTFHRAFDFVENPLDAIVQLVDAGVTNVLTSGQEVSAIHGKKLIVDLVRIVNGAVNIIPGSGINSENIILLKEVEGINIIHSSSKRTIIQRDKPFRIERFEFDSTEYLEMMKVIESCNISKYK